MNLGHVISSMYHLFVRGLHFLFALASFSDRLSRCEKMAMEIIEGEGKKTSFFWSFQPKISFIGSNLFLYLPVHPTLWPKKRFRAKSDASFGAGGSLNYTQSTHCEIREVLAPRREMRVFFI